MAVWRRRETKLKRAEREGSSVFMTEIQHVSRKDGGAGWREAGSRGELRQSGGEVQARQISA